MRTAVALVFALICLSLAGCGGGAGAVVGKWSGTMQAPAGKENDPSTKMMADLAKDAMNFEFKADKTFTGTMLIPIEGTYEVSGNTVTVHVTKAMGVESKGKDDKPLVLTLSADGKTLTGNDPNGKGGSLAFTKQS